VGWARTVQVERLKLKLGLAQLTVLFPRVLQPLLQAAPAVIQPSRRRWQGKEGQRTEPNQWLGTLELELVRFVTVLE
jgi:hypothetical protein